MNDRLCIKYMRDSLIDNATDPRVQWTSNSRVWIHTDRPLTSASYPRVRITKRGPSERVIISMGENFWEWREMVLDIQFWTQIGFRWKNSDNEYLQDDYLVEEYLHHLWATLKAQQSTLRTTYGITGLKNVQEGVPYQEPGTQLWTGILSVRVWYFWRNDS